MYARACYSADQIRHAYGVDQLGTRRADGPRRDDRARRLVRVADDLERPADVRSGQQPAGPALAGGDLAGRRAAGLDPTLPGQLGWAEETTLDVEFSHAMAPGANILLVETPVAETEGVQGFPQMIEAEKYVIDHHLADVISQSFGATEQTFQDAHGQLRPVPDLRPALRVQDAAAHGVTVLAATGDAGVTDYELNGTDSTRSAVVDWPASDPLVTAVGGLQLNLDAAATGSRLTASGTTARRSALAPCAGSGGVSAVFSRPSYQDGVRHVVGGARGIPDVSMSAPSTAVSTCTRASRRRSSSDWYRASVAPARPRRCSRVRWRSPISRRSPARAASTRRCTRWATAGAPASPTSPRQQHGDVHEQQRRDVHGARDTTPDRLRPGKRPRHGESRLPAGTRRAGQPAPLAVNADLVPRRLGAARHARCLSRLRSASDRADAVCAGAPEALTRLPDRTRRPRCSSDRRLRRRVAARGLVTPRVGRSAGGSGDRFEPLRRQHPGVLPGKSLTIWVASRPAGRPSIAGRRSSRLMAKRRLGAICRSATFGGSPPRMPSSIQSSIRWSILGKTAIARRTLSSVAPGTGHRPRKGAASSQRLDAHPVFARLEVADQSVRSCGRTRGRSLGSFAGAPRRRSARPPPRLVFALDRRETAGAPACGVELAGDRPRSLYPLTVDLGCGHGHVGESESLEHDPRDDRQQVSPLVVDSLVIEQQLTLSSRRASRASKRAGRSSAADPSNARASGKARSGTMHLGLDEFPALRVS